jgi:tetratricopeptide (TPR) repeat protein
MHWQQRLLASRSLRALRQSAAAARGSGCVARLIDVLFEIARRYRSGRNPEKALDPLLEATELARRSKHPALRPILLNLATLQADLERMIEAEAGADELIALGAGASESDRLAYCQAFLVKAAAAFATSTLDRTESCYRTAVAEAAELLGDGHPLALHSRQELADLLVTAERFHDALNEQRTLCDLAQQVYGPSDLRFAYVLNRLAIIHDELGDHLIAKDLFRQLLDFRRDLLGPDDPLVAESMYNVAELARATRDSETAEAGFREVMAVEERLRGRGTPLFGFLLKNYGLLRADQGHADEAEPLLLEAIEVAGKHKAKGEGIHALASAALALGHVFIQSGQPAKARRWLNRALAIHRRRSGPKSPSSARVLLGLAACSGQQGKRAVAVRLAKEAVDLMVASLGDRHWETSGARHQFAIHLAAEGEWQWALEIMETAAEADDEFIVEALRNRSRRQVREAVGAIRRRLLEYLGVLCRFEGRTPAQLRRAYDYVLRRKGLESAGARLQRDSGLLMLTGVEMELRRLRRRLLRLRLRSAAGGARGENILAMEHLRRDIDELEARLALSVPPERIRLHLFGKTAELVSRGLPAGAALIEFVAGVPPLSGPYVDSRVSEQRLLAFVLHAEVSGQVELVDLGRSEEVSEAIDRFRAALEAVPSESGSEPPAWLSIGEQVRSMVFDRLAEACGEAQQIFVATDGPVDRLVLETLPIDADVFLLDRYCVSYLQSGRELSPLGPISIGARAAGRALPSGERLVPGAAAPPPEANRPVDARPIEILEAERVCSAPMVVADPDFDASLGPDGVFLGVPELDPDFRTVPQFARLAATAVEGRGIARRLNVKPRLGQEAVKPAFARLRSPEILHVSTHGFLGLRSAETGSEDDRFEVAPFYRMLSAFDDPMLRCGLALAGANPSVAGSPAERAAAEGLLWATEVLELDLRSTDLVVLSACHTGIGESDLGDGTASLRRAFKIAGARSVVSSMWAVSDDLTQELMANLYDRLLAKMPRAQALWQSKLVLRRRYPRDPFAWGAFILDGEALALNRFNPLRVGQLRMPQVYNELLAEQNENDNSKAARLFARARRALDKRHASEALPLFRRVLTTAGVTQPLADKANYQIASIYRRSGKFEQARDRYTRLLERPDLAIQLRLNTHFDRGTAFMGLGDYQAAIEDLTEILLSSETFPPEVAMTLVNRGLSFWMLGDLDAAIEDFSSVLALADAPEGQQSKARINRGRIFAASGDYQNAVADYTAALALIEAPEDQQGARLLRASALVEQGRDDEAKADVLELLKIASANTPIYASARQLLEQIENH